jgi:signal transduction histidine kinase
VATIRSTSAPGWRLVVQHASGSLEGLVAKGRQRNLVLSFGMLALLGASVVLLAINAQRAQRLADQQMDFVATVSHELRTPLAVIQSAAQNLAAGVVSEASQTKRYGELIDAEGRRLTDMVEQILTFARLATAPAPAKTTGVADAAAVARAVATSFEALATREQVAIAVDAPEAAAVGADESTVRRILTNLIGNALKYGSSGKWIGVSVQKAGGDRGDEVELRVADRGRGIDPEDLPHVFDAFYRGGTVIDRRARGNGLGLALVKRIVEGQGGRIEVESTRGKGATFIVRLPAARIPHESITADLHAEPSRAPLS